MYETKRYVTRGGVDVLAAWHKSLTDVKAKIAVDRRIARVESGNFGDHKPLRDGVWELRVDTGQGYRVYYAIAGKMVVLLLCGGGKSTQNADIASAVACWKDWQARAKEDENEKPITR